MAEEVRKSPRISKETYNAIGFAIAERLGFDPEKYTDATVYELFFELQEVHLKENEPAKERHKYDTTTRLRVMQAVRDARLPEPPVEEAKPISGEEMADILKVLELIEKDNEELWSEVNDGKRQILRVVANSNKLREQWELFKKTNSTKEGVREAVEAMDKYCSEVRTELSKAMDHFGQATGAASVCSRRMDKLEKHFNEKIAHLNERLNGFFKSDQWRTVTDKQNKIIDQLSTVNEEQALRLLEIEEKLQHAEKELKVIKQLPFAAPGVKKEKAASAPSPVKPVASAPEPERLKVVILGLHPRERSFVAQAYEEKIDLTLLDPSVTEVNAVRKACMDQNVILLERSKTNVSKTARSVARKFFLINSNAGMSTVTRQLDSMLEEHSKTVTA